MGRLVASVWILSMLLPAACLCGQPPQADNSAEVEKLMNSFTQAVAHGNLLDPEGALDLLRQLQPKMDREDWTDARDRLLIELVRRGDRVVSRYVTGDEVPQQKSDYDRCAAYFEAANQLDSSPRSQARMWFCRGRSLLEPDDQKNFDLAIEDLKKAIQDEPDAGYHYNALGIAYLEQARNTEAAEQFRGAIQREPGWAYPRHHLALTYLETGDYVSAQQAYREAIAVATSNKLQFGYLHYNLGLLAHQLGRKKEARREYERALELFQQQRKRNEDMAAKLNSDGNSDDAQAALARARIFIRDEAEAYNALGALSASQGKTKEAEQAYKDALELNPDLAAARQNLELLRGRGKGQVSPKTSPSTATVSASGFHPKD